MLTGLYEAFNISPVLCIVPVFVLTLALFKVPPVVAMLSSSVLAIVLGSIVQSGVVDPITLINSAGIGFSIETGVADLNVLLNRGGIASMMEVVAWTLLTLGMGRCV